ncbi:related to SGD1-essential nuclear protein, required for biogenesis of the small ribosomal subunit [Ustilago bromivora]|uniref:Related to SGD1 - essential nuclear protein, required for biogenesis of the small ribosomal subunit n=1 Tax=Ustilago bromivora TaxID=307758 RepID=A0A1K0HJ95_9BASI|nr:related to SGD1-essential nuclear protein, required for biogenesis of the small ribosomal subunit [Ustilago bromivora]SYW77710.1 related to SGD1 - essential nuclear protein, required for biogenesis of the small ribosomal subunit [Ustilago bromivora]
MPFDPRTKSRKTTTLPAALRDELGLPAPSAGRRNFKPHDRRFDSRQGKAQLKVIGRPQNDAPRGPIKSLRNQEKEQQEEARQRHQSQPQQQKPKPKPKQHSQEKQKKDAAPSSASKAESSKRKHEERPSKELQVVKKPKSTLSQPPLEEPKTKLNPFTGELELVQPAKKKASSAGKPTALEKMLARAEAGPSSKGKAKATDGLGGPLKKKSRRQMTQQEKEEEDEIRWLEYSLGKSRQGEDVVRDDLDDFLDDLDRFQVGMYDRSDSDGEGEGEGEGEEGEGKSDDDSGLEEVSVNEEESTGESDEEESEVEKGESEEGREEEDEEEEGLYDFDSNDEADFSNWDAAMATTDEEAEQEDPEEEEEEEKEKEESDDDSEELDSEAEEARALISGSASSTDATSSSAPAAPATATKYIPPALRAKMPASTTTTTSSSPSTTATFGAGVTDSEMDPLTAQKLRRQVQGLLNRLGDANIDTILAEYESLYRTHPRAHVTSTITQLILDTITSRSNLIDTFVILHAALVAALHKVVGVEFAAYFITRLVEDLTRHYEELKKDSNKAEGEEEEGRGKECMNLTVLLCELYNLHVAACPLIYDLIRMFLGTSEEKKVGEVDIELLLKTIRSCGHSLRHDDPTSLKAIIGLTQSRVASSPASSTLPTRTKFMLERMNDLQSSKKGSANTNDASDPNSPSGQLLTRMKKYLSGLSKKRAVRSHEELRIGLKDLQDADKKGKWWLVGAAWTGQNDQNDAQGLTKLLPMNARANAIQSSPSSSLEQGEQSGEQQRLLGLARVQGMNTDARRTVFLTLITSEDYKEAAENVLMLKLNDVQRREIIRVLVHCLGSESVYNPYYTLIGQEICSNDHGMRITLQYCLWDFLREIGQKEVGGEKFAAALSTPEEQEEGKSVHPRRVANLARAYAWWFSHDCLSLQALKTVDFTMVMQERPRQFLGLLLVHMVLSLQAKSPAKTLHLPTVTGALKEGNVVKWMQSNLMGGSVDLTRGLLFFLNTKLHARAQKALILGEEKGSKAVRVKMKPLLETVKEGLGVMVRTVQMIVQQQDGVAASTAEDVVMQSDSDDDDSIGDDSIGNGF